MRRFLVICAILCIASPALAQRFIVPGQHANPNRGILPLIKGGTQCSVPLPGLTVATLPAGAMLGETCSVNDATTCTAGTVAAGGGSTKCAFTWCGTSWLPAECATSAAAGGVTAVNATSPIASSGGTTPTISITNPLPVANGGTNATAAGAAAANNIGALAQANNLSDVANAGTSRTNITAAKSGANSDITSITGLTTPLAINQGGNGSTTPGLTAGTGITLGSTWPTQSVALTTPVSVANGGTGTATPGLTAGNGLSVSGSFPAQQFVLSTPVSVANGGTQCGPPTTVASLPGSPTQGEICNVTDATACNQGSAVVGGGTTKCQVVWNGASWLPGGGANSNGVTSVTATSPVASTGGTTPVISLGTVPVANGGTNGTTASKTTANNIGAAELGADSSITSLTGLTTPLSVAQGGSGTATPSLQAGANITISGSWPNQTITGSAGGSVLPINQLPNQTGNYNAQGFQLKNLGAPSVTGDALSQGNAISGTSGSFSFFATAPYFSTSGANPATLGLLRDINSNTSVMARNQANSANINEIGTSANVVVVGDVTNASTITLSNPLTNPLATGSGGTGIASPTAHDVPITEGASAFNLIALATDQVLIGSTGADPGTFTVPNCGDATHALAYTTSGHFTCQTLSGGGSGTAGFVQNPTVTAGNPATVTALTSCASAGCTDDNRVANPSGNANPLQITLPSTATTATDGQYLTVSVADGATPESAINWVAGSGFSFKSAVLGDTDASPGSAAACGTPPANGGMYYVWKITRNAAIEKLLQCGPDPSFVQWPVVLGGTGGTSASKTTANNIGAAELGANSSITSITGLTTPLSAAQGGTGVASPTAFGLLYGNGTGAFGNVVLANDQLLVGNTGAAPAASTGSLICGDSTHALAYSHAAGFFCQAITATASAGGTTGSMQWNNGGALAGLSGTGIPILQGSGTPIILAGNTLAAHNFANSINASGVIAGAQPACGDLSNAATSCSTDTTNASNISSGTLGAARLPNPSASTLGGVQSAAAQPHQWINSVSTTGVPALSQPAFSDISGAIVTSQLPVTGVAAASYTNTNLTVDATGRITAASSGTGGGGTPAGFINSPAFASPVILVTQCTSPGCTDDNRVANGSNSGTLTLQLPASTGMADGEFLKITVTDTGTAPSSIVWTSGTGITFKSALTGDTDGTPGSANACGSPPATGTSQYLWWISYVTPGINTAAIARLVQCGPDPSGATITPALGGLIGATFGAAFDFVGTPGSNQLQGLTEVYTMNIPANYVGSACTCGTAPGTNQSYPIACNGVAKGTLTVNTTCTATANALNATWPTQAAYQCTSGQALTLTAPASPSGADILCTIAFQR